MSLQSCFNGFVQRCFHFETRDQVCLLGLAAFPIAFPIRSFLLPRCFLRRLISFVRNLVRLLYL
jgi:hypothetical protein